MYVNFQFQVQGLLEQLCIMVLMLEAVGHEGVLDFQKLP